MAADNKRKKRRSRITGWILALSGIAAGLVAWITYKADKAVLAATPAAHHNAHGAAGVALAGFAGTWIVFASVSFVIWGFATLGRSGRNSDQPTKPRRRSRNYRYGRS
jgi:hypothetical protein